MDIYNYLNENDLRKLCTTLNMPEEVTNRVTEIAAAYDFSEIAPYFHMLFDIKTGEDGYKKITELLESNLNKGFMWLTVYLAAAIETRNRYVDMGIDHKIFIDTFSSLSRFTREYMARNGEYGYDRFHWNYRQVAQTIYRLGELEYEMRDYPGEDIVTDNINIHHGDNILSIHIPSDANVSSISCHESYRLAVEFFKEYYPNFKYEYFYCNSWLMSPNLKHVLSEGSRILEFQRDFQVCTVISEDTAYKSWVFHSKGEIEDFPENTSLQRNMKKYLLSGGKIGRAICVFNKNKFGG